MKDWVKKINHFGFHDTFLTSITCCGLEIKLEFENGLYFLDKKGKETVLSNPINLTLKINPFYESAINALEIKEYGKKLKYIEYIDFKNDFKKSKFSIGMVYFSNFGNSFLFDGGFPNKMMLISIEGVDDITIEENA